MGGCCGKEAGPDAEIYRSAQRSRLPDTEADREARAAAAAAVSRGRAQLGGDAVFGASGGRPARCKWWPASSGRPQTHMLPSGSLLPCVAEHTLALLIPPPPPPPPQAEARQQKWAGTPVGKAALKSVKQVQEERAAGRPDSKDTVKDWLS